MGKPFVEPSSWTHHKAEVSPGVKLHYVDVRPSPLSSPSTTSPSLPASAGRESSSSSSSSAKAKTIVLLHGFPQTWYSFRHVIAPLSTLGFRVIAVDYRGAGNSDKPRDGYDKFTMARDIRNLYYDVLGSEKVVLVGADIGSMVATSLAVQYADEIEALISFEAPIPGTKAYSHVTSDPSTTWPLFWHFFWHNIPDLPELLIQGKEREYISHFYHRLSYDPSFLTEDDLDIYTKAFSQAGAIRAGLDTYRAFPQDAKDLSEYLEQHGKIGMPTLTMSGDASAFHDFVEDQTREYASDVSYVRIPHSCHWIMEENPEGWVEALKSFFGDKGLLP